MRIEEVSYDLLRPITTSKGKVGVRSGWIITLEEGEFSGQGEVLPLEGWSDLTIDEAYSQLVECDNSIMGTQRLSKEVQSAINTASWNLEAAALDDVPWPAHGKPWSCSQRAVRYCTWYTCASRGSDSISSLMLGHY